MQVLVLMRLWLLRIGSTMPAAILIKVGLWLGLITLLVAAYAKWKDDIEDALLANIKLQVAEKNLAQMYKQQEQSQKALREQELLANSFLQSARTFRDKLDEMDNPCLDAPVDSGLSRAILKAGSRDTVQMPNGSTSQSSTRPNN